MSFARALISPRLNIAAATPPVFYRGPFSSRFARCPIRGGEASIYGQAPSGAVLRLAVLAVVVVYALPHVLRPTPPVILSARQFVTANLESAAAELMPSDVARSIDTFIGAISR